MAYNTNRCASRCILITLRKILTNHLSNMISSFIKEMFWLFGYETWNLNRWVIISCHLYSQVFASTSFN